VYSTHARTQSQPASVKFFPVYGIDRDALVVYCTLELPTFRKKQDTPEPCRIRSAHAHAHTYPPVQTSPNDGHCACGWCCSFCAVSCCGASFSPIAHLPALQVSNEKPHHLPCLSWLRTGGSSEENHRDWACFQKVCSEGQWKSWLLGSDSDTVHLSGSWNRNGLV